MSANSSYLPRLGFSRSDGPILPFHNRMSPPIRKKPSEYDLADLSPRPEDGLPSSPMDGRKSAYSPRRSPSPSTRYSDNASNTGSSKSRPRQPALFAGPPPPIAVSQVLYRDEEDQDTSPAAPRHLEASTFARTINSVLFDRNPSSPNRTRSQDYDPKPDAIWLNLQRRERALQKDLQHLLDAQSAGLAANLDPNAAAAPPSSSSAAPSEASDDTRTRTRSITPTHPTSSPTSRRSRHVTFHDHQSPPTISGTPIPVRQPPPTKPPGLRAARLGLARSIALLADLKAEEDAQLTAALGTRKQALSHLRRWTARRAGIAEELRLLEEEEEGEGDGDGGGERDGGGQQPLGALGRELRELQGEREVVGGEIAELEERLEGLRRRKAWLDGRVAEVSSRREAGLSGYRGALREVEGRIGGLLGRPGVRPLDGEFFSSSSSRSAGEEGEESIGGVEFLRLRPERRTAEMAKEWWEGEVGILERRKVEVDKEKVALEEGVEVWKGAVRLVSEFEADLRKEMKGGGDAETSNGKGKGKMGEPAVPPSLEQAMYAQLDKMRAVMAGLEERLHVVEENGWNLLICAIGAELEAFRQAESMLREALRAAGFDVGDDDGEQGGSTPHLGRSTSLRDSSQRLDKAEPTGGGKLVDLHEEPDDDREPESDNEVPPDLLVAAAEEHEPVSPDLSREDSNEIPAEFLMEHALDGEDPGLGVMG